MSEQPKIPNSQLKDDPPQLIVDDGSVEQSGSQLLQDLSGQIVADHYEIVSLLGTGGLGTVYKAHHKLLNKTVAIKFLRTGKNLDARAVRRFQREAQTAIGLVHPNIASVQEFGLHDDMPFIVMEFASGESLEQIVERGYLEPARALNITKQLLQALSHAHKHGIVHRDVKPANIIVFTTDAGAEEVKLIDFGIAKIVENENRTDITKAGSILGTPYYMSPEQCRSAATDHRTDIYAAGCVAYEMLEGVPPFKGTTAVEVLLKHINDAPMVLPPPSGVAGFELVIDKALAKEPEQRYASADEMLSELELLESGKAPRNTFYLNKRKLQRKLIYTVLALLAVACAAVYFVGLVTHEKSTAELSKAIRQHPEVVSNYIDRAKLYHARGNQEAALMDITTAEKLDPNNAEIEKLKSSFENNPSADSTEK